MDRWGSLGAGDGAHPDERPRRSSRETVGTSGRFDLSTPRSRVRRRIPLTSDSGRDVVSIEAEPPPRTAEGSSPDVFRTAGITIPVEVRLRRDHAPSPAQVDDVLAWLRKHRVGTFGSAGTPGPAPAPAAPSEPAPIPLPPAHLQPVHPAEAPRGALWPIVALSFGLAVALLAALVL